MAGTNIYEMVTDRIIAELEKGFIPWQRPWTGVRSGAFNRVSKRPYSILNQMLLMKPGEWATFKQWKDAGGSVKKGEKASMVVFWKVMQKEEEKDGETIIKGYPVLRYYNVFHIDQVEGVEPLPEEELKDTKPIEEAENVLADYVNREHVDFQQIRSNEAYYSPFFDHIRVPLLEQFDKPEEAYSTYFHEAVHSTGHKSRLNRFEESAGNAAFGSESYSKEELVAEIGSATICNYLKIETDYSFRNSAAYIQGWLRALNDDKKLIVSAASKAEKAVNLILNINA